jgi:Ubiquitin carboxyl-terminal hydrolase
VLPVTHGFWSTRSGSYVYASAHQFQEFGIPLYIVVNKDEKGDFGKIYEKIRRRYAQFSTAEELQNTMTAPEEVVDESDAEGMEDIVEETVLTRQDVTMGMVNIRVQLHNKHVNIFSHSRTPEGEMPTTLDKPENMYNLREYLVPPPARHESLAPSAMESIHQDISTPPDSDHGADIFVDAFDDGDTSEGTMYFSQQGSFLNERTEPETAASDADDNYDVNSIPFEMDLDFGNPRGPTPEMQDDSDDEPSASLLGETRAHAPSPTLPDSLPPYSLFPNESVDNDTRDDAHELKFGDALLCEWSENAYQHVFTGRNTALWDDYVDWIDPSPPVITAPKKLNLDLDDCLDEFAREEQLGEDDLWYCPRCKEHRQARKTLQLWRVPDIFAVHLKRFSASRGMRDKLDDKIDFPIKDLDLTDRVGDKTWITEERGGEKLVYDLFAVDNHYGGLGGGHYTAWAQNYVDGKWYYFDGMCY